MKPEEEIGITTEDLLNHGKFLKKMGLIDARLQELVSLTIQDPLVRGVKWSPNQGSTASFRTHALQVMSPQRLEFKATKEAYRFSITLVLLGIAAAALNFWERVPSGGKLVGVLAVSASFVIAGCYLLLRRTEPFVFDVRRGMFWRGRENPGVNSRNSRNRISDIHALQLIAVYNNRSRKGVGYDAYELNLVLHDGERVTVTSHGARQKLVSDAETVAAALKKPLWNAIDIVLPFYRALQSRS